MPESRLDSGIADYVSEMMQDEDDHFNYSSSDDSIDSYSGDEYYQNLTAQNADGGDLKNSAVNNLLPKPLEDFAKTQPVPIDTLKKLNSFLIKASKSKIHQVRSICKDIQKMVRDFVVSSIRKMTPFLIWLAQYIKYFVKNPVKYLTKMANGMLGWVLNPIVKLLMAFPPLKVATNMIQRLDPSTIPNAKRASTSIQKTA